VLLKALSKKLLTVLNAGAAVELVLFPNTVLAADVLAPVPPLAIGRVPVTPVLRGSPVALVNVSDVGVPKAGVTRVGEVANTLLPVPVLAIADTTPDDACKDPVRLVANVVVPVAVNVVNVAGAGVVAPIVALLIPLVVIIASVLVPSVNVVLLDCINKGKNAVDVLFTT
jgi:hypothetical protein